MTRPKSPNPKVTPTTTTDLRTGDSDRLRAEIGVFREKIVDLIGKDPRKAGTLMSEWLDRPAGKSKSTHTATPSIRKKAA
jgi:hypothetical protein